MKKILKYFDDHNINYRKLLVILYVLLVMIPVLVSLGVNNSGKGVVPKTIASILLLVFFIAFFIYDYKKKIAEDWGIKSLSATVNGYNKAREVIKESKNIKLLISYDIEDVYDIVAECCNNTDCKYDILIFNPYCKYAELIGYGDDYAASVEKFENLARSATTEINIKYYSKVPLDNMFIADDNVFIFPHTQRLSDGRRFVRYCKGNKKGSAYYNDVFANAWEHPVYEESEV